MKTLSSIFACCCLLAAVACGPSQVGSKFVKSQDVKASQGAVIDVSGSDSSVLSGTKLEVPGGALSKDTTITLELGTTDLVTNSKASPVAIWKPSGLHFTSPATLTMPLTLAQGQTVDHLNIQVKEDDGTSFRIPRSDLVVTGTSVTFKIDGFTSFQANTQNACMADSDCSAGETCVNGGCSGGMGGGQGGGMGGGNGGGGANACQTDTDCAMGEACRNGVCTGGQGGGMGGGQGGGSNACQVDTDCPMGDVCTNGVCVGGQGGGMGGGQGGGNPDGGLVCMTDTDCQNGDVCINGQCTASTDGGFCRVDTDCPMGELCDANTGTCYSGGNDGGTDGGQPDGGPSDGGMDGGQPDGGPSDGGADGGQPDGGQTCQTDLDCPMPELCVQNFCEAIACDMNRPCPGNYQCVNNWCQ